MDRVNDLKWAIDDVEYTLAHAKSVASDMLDGVPENAWPEMQEMYAKISDMLSDARAMISQEWFNEMVYEQGRIDYENECRADAISY